MSRASEIVIVLALVGCGHSRGTTTAHGNASSTGGSSSSASASTQPATESFECRASRMRVEDEITGSRRTHTCTVATECAVITGPGHPSPEYAEVVFAADAATLDAHARDHLARCGAFHTDPSTETFTTIEAACVAQHCAAQETTFHPDPIE